MKKNIAVAVFIALLVVLGLIFIFSRTDSGRMGIGQGGSNSGGDTSTWKTYTRADEGFSFKYPQEWGDVSYRQDPEAASNGLLTITFTNSAPIIVFSSSDKQPWKGGAYTGTDSLDKIYSTISVYKTSAQYISIEGVLNKGLLVTYTSLAQTSKQDNISQVNFYLQLPGKPYTGLLVYEALDDQLNASTPATNQDKINAQGFISNIQNGTASSSVMNSINVFKRFIGTFVFK